MNLKTFFRKVVGLANTWIDDVGLEGSGATKGVVASARTSWRIPRCGTCGKKSVRLHGQQAKSRRWRHLGAFGHPVFISSAVHRVFCSRCGVKTMLVPWARTGSVFTRLFENEVTWFVQRTDRTTTSGYFGISWVTVGKIATRVVEEKLDRALLKDLLAIGVDEIYYGRPKKYLTVVVDLLTGRVIWSGEGQSAATLGRFFEEIGKEERAKIRIVSMDMDLAFEKAVRDCVPQAEIIYDRFHVVQMLNEAIDETRRELMREMEDDPDGRAILKGSRWPLLKNPWNMTRRERERLSTIAIHNKKLYRAYLLKEAFQEIYEATSVETADALFTEWYAWARRSRLEEMRRVAQTFKQRWEGIRRYVEFKFSNGIVEGFNSKIRMLSHRAFGFHSAQALIAMIHLCCSGVSITPVGQGHPELLHTL